MYLTVDFSQLYYDRFVIWPEFSRQGLKLIIVLSSFPLYSTSISRHETALEMAEEFWPCISLKYISYLNKEALKELTTHAHKDTKISLEYTPRHHMEIHR